MEFDQLIIVFASIATCVTAVIILFTLLEMKKQRSMSYKPTLVPIRQFIDALKSGDNFCWREKSEEHDESSLSYNYPLHIFNIGNGAAKNINVKWKLNIQPVIDSVNSLFQKNMTQSYIEVTKNNWLKIKSGGTTKQSINIDLDMEGQYDHLLPAHIDREGISIRIPYSFITLVSHYFHEGGKRLNNDEESIISNTPNIDLIITYEDIVSDKYSESYTLFVSMSMYSDTTFHAILDNKKTLTNSLSGRKIHAA